MVTKLFGNIFTNMKKEPFHNFFYRKDKYKKEIFLPKSQEPYVDRYYLHWQQYLPRRFYNIDYIGLQRRNKRV